MLKKMITPLSQLALATAISVGGATVARAADAPSEAPAAPTGWWDTFAYGGQIELGTTLNPDGPSDGINFGHAFTDRANTILMNQLLLTAARPIDPKAPGYDFGFKVQGMYGTDARFTHSFDLLDRAAHERYQFDLVEANLQAHLPWLTDGGIDVKAGIFVTPLGFEVIDPKGDYLYSHSYIFNYGIPLKNTGILTTTHVSPMLDIYVGIDSGVNASIGSAGDGDNNGVWAGQGGFGLNLLDGSLTIVALTHIGAENPQGTAGIDVNRDLRYLNDVLITWKVNDKYTSVTELNYIRDDGGDASGGGIAQYLIYAYDDAWSFIGRAEMWREDKGFFVAKFPGAFDFVNVERGFANTAVSGGKNTYGALTLGANFKPEVPKMFEGLVIRPEIRFDNSLAGNDVFDDGKSDHQYTIGIDAVVPF